MKVIGIAGGVACGKSLVAAQLAKLGAVVLDADKVGHEVLFDEDVKQAIKQRWGDAVIDDCGEVSRKELARIVFAPKPAGPAELEHLETIVHPKITQRLRQRINEIEGDDPVAVAVLDAAVMFKTGWDQYCDQILFIDASADVRHRRAMQRGWTEETWRARENSQASLDDKRRRADVMIDNSGTKEETFRQVQQFWNELVGEPTPS